MPLSPRSLAPIIENAFPINGLNKETFDNLNLYIPDPDFCYSDTIGVNKTPKDGNVAMWLNKKQPNTQMVVGSLTSDVGWSIVQPTSGSVTFSSNGVRINSIDGTLASINTGWFVGSAVKTLTLGNTYKLRFKAVMISGIIQITDSAANVYANITTSGTFEILFSATATTTFTIKRGGGNGSDGTISDLSITDLGVSLVQTVAGNQPKLRKGSKNWILNSSLTGFVTGTPGTVPSNWNYGSTTGVTRQIVAIGTEDINGVSLPYVDVNFSSSGTNTAGEVFLDPLSSGSISASSGQTWAYSVYLKLLNGTIPSSYIQIHERDSSNAFLIASNTSVNGMTSNLNKYSVSRLFNQATTARLSVTIRFNVPANTVFNFTVRIVAPQLELGTSTTSDTHVLTNGSPASNGVGNWWLDFDGTLTFMTFNKLPISNDSVGNFTSSISINNRSTSLGTVYSQDDHPNSSRLGSHFYNTNNIPLIIHRDINSLDSGVGFSQQTLSTPILMSVKRDNNNYKFIMNNQTINNTVSLSTLNTTRAQIGRLNTGNTFLGALYGLCTCNWNASDTEYNLVNKYLAYLTGVNI